MHFEENCNTETRLDFIYLEKKYIKKLGVCESVCVYTNSCRECF